MIVILSKAKDLLTPERSSSIKGMLLTEGDPNCQLLAPSS